MKNKNKKKNWRNEVFFHILTIAIMVKSGLSLKVKVQIRIFECTGIMGHCFSFHIQIYSILILSSSPFTPSLSVAILNLQDFSFTCIQVLPYFVIIAHSGRFCTVHVIPKMFPNHSSYPS